MMQAVRNGGFRVFSLFLSLVHHNSNGKTCELCLLSVTSAGCLANLHLMIKISILIRQPMMSNIFAIFHQLVIMQKQHLTKICKVTLKVNNTSQRFADSRGHCLQEQTGWSNRSYDDTKRETESGVFAPLRYIWRWLPSSSIMHKPDVNLCWDRKSFVGVLEKSSLVWMSMKPNGVCSISYGFQFPSGSAIWEFGQKYESSLPWNGANPSRIACKITVP